MDASPGAEIWAWFDNGNATELEIDAQWKELCGILSGLFCASLSFIDQSNTIAPKFALQPTFSLSTGVSSQPQVDRSRFHIRYATLPREIVCTENLTPWKKLLPCHPHEGLMSLLNSGYIHSTNYHSLGLHMRRLVSQSLNKTATDEHKEVVEIRQTVNLVFDKKVIQTERDWSLRKLFGQGLNGASEMATVSRLYLDITDQDFDLALQPSEIIVSQRGGVATQLAMYDVKKDFSNQLFNVAAIHKKDDNDNRNRPIVPLTMPSPLYAKRFVLGVGRDRGHIVTKVTNTHWTALNVVLLENLPWYVPVYLHTMTIKVSGTNEIIKPNHINYIPGRLRERPSRLEVAFVCPSRKTVEISIGFDYVFLKWLEYPPDANHGHYIGSAILTAQLPIARNYTAVPIDGHLFADSFNASRLEGYLISVRTESLLISMPTPDFSMPYNVICLACTVVALAFGPIHNLSTKKLKFVDKTKSDEKPKSIFGKLKQIFRKKNDSAAEECSSVQKAE